MSSSPVELLDLVGAFVKKRMWRALFENFGRQHARGVSDQLSSLSDVQFGLRSEAVAQKSVLFKEEWCQLFVVSPHALASLPRHLLLGVVGMPGS